MLGIPESNFPGPNGHRTELKGCRKKSHSKITLLTKAPLPDGINSDLWNGYGYPPKKNRASSTAMSTISRENKVLYTTLPATRFNTLKGKPGFKIHITADRVEIHHSEPYKSMSVPYWDKNTLRKRFLEKFPDKLLYVKANTKGRGKEEHFHYDEAYLLSGFSFDKITDLLSAEDIRADIRIGQYPNGRLRDHGTGFRIYPNKLDMCFADSKRVL